MSDREKIRREKDLEANSVTFRRSRRKHWQTGLLVASVLAATALLFAVIGLVTGLGVVRRDGGEPCSVDVASDPTTATTTDVEGHVMSRTTKCPLHPSPSPLPTPLTHTIQSAITTLEDQLAHLVDAETMPGLVAGITYRDEEIWTNGFGSTRKRAGRSTPSKDTIYRIASVSKIFVVLMVYQLYDRGLLRSLDDPLNAFCPDFHINNPFTADNITIRQIISSMSGLPREAPCGHPPDPSVNLCPHTTTTIMQRLSQQSTILPPWTKPSYSNLGFALLGRCLVPFFFPDLSYEEYILRHILKPLGMNSTGFNYTNHSVLERLATGYLSDGSAEPLYDVGWWAPAGQMYSTLGDLNKLAKFFYSAGGAEDSVHSSVLSPTLRRMMLLPTYTNRDLETGIGTPWEVQFQDGYTVLMKGGNLRGYSAVFSIIPDLQLGLNILFSGSASKLTVATQAHSLLIPAFVQALTIRTSYSLPPNTIHYMGIYTAKWSSGDIAVASIHLHDGSLALSGSAFNNIYLTYKEPLRFQIEFADDELSCLSSELLALRHTWLYFDSPPKSTLHWQATSFTMPGFSPGLNFTRI